MKLTKCSNNHFYDADKFSQCPHCGQAVKQAPSTSIQIPQSHRDISREQEAPRSGKTIAKTSSMWQTFRESTPEPEQISTVRGAETPSPIPAPFFEDRTEPVNNIPEKQPDMTIAPAQWSPAETPMPRSEEREEPRPENAGVLRNAVDMARGCVHTEDTKTVAFYNFAESEPVVGWIVCVKGAYLGESFPLKAGKNFVGRSLKMDVALAKDPTVSRDRHAIVIFEPKKRKFFLQPGEGSGLTYINEDLLMIPVEMHDFDKLQFGEGEYIFKPLCGENFTWDDYT